MTSYGMSSFLVILGYEGTSKFCGKKLNQKIILIPKSKCMHVFLYNNSFSLSMKYLKMLFYTKISLSFNLIFHETLYSVLQVSVLSSMEMFLSNLQVVAYVGFFLLHPLCITHFFQNTREIFHWPPMPGPTRMGRTNITFQEIPSTDRYIAECRMCSTHKAYSENSGKKSTQSLPI